MKRRFFAGMWALSGFDYVATTKASGTRSIAAHPCEKRKDGAPSVENCASRDQERPGYLSLCCDGKRILIAYVPIPCRLARAR
jgi:hypothetical protein